MNDQNTQLDQIEKMLRAQLKGQGHIWWISGYVYGQTSQDDLFIILYPADDRLSEKVVRVYPQDFKKLPPFIPTDVDGGDTDANPNREQARKRNIYHECPMFEVVTYDGRETQMGKERRFGDVLRISSTVAKRPSPASQPQPRSTVQPRRTAAPPTVTDAPMPDDELVVSEAAATAVGFINAVAQVLAIDAATVKDRLRALGYKTVPRDTAKRIEIYRHIRTAVTETPAAPEQDNLFGETSEIAHAPALTGAYSK